MKKFASIAVVACLLFGVAIYLANLQGVTSPTPTPQTPEPAVSPSGTNGLPITQASAPGTLTLSAQSSQGYLSPEETTSLYATLDVKAIKHQSAQRPALNVSIVIDRSGSMSGDKIVHARQAAKQLVNLLGPKDRVSVVSYSNDVTVDFPSSVVDETSRARLLGAIDSIYIGGGTNLAGGFEYGLNQVNAWKNGDSLNRVVLLSDGRANIGETSVEVLAGMARQGLQGDVSLSTIGLGLDYNEDLMTAMANNGAGNYHFVDDSSEIASIFEKELNGLANSVAKQANVMVSLKDGVILDELYGFSYKRNGTTIMIPLAEFYSEQEKNILLKLKVAGKDTPTRPLFSATLQYSDIVKGNANQNQHLALSSVTSKDIGQITGSVNTDVIGRVQQVEIATSMNDAMQAYEQGKAEEARGILERQNRRIQSAQAQYNFGSGQAAKFEGAQRELDVISDAVRAAPSPSSAPAKRMIKAKKARGNYILFDRSTF